MGVPSVDPLRDGWPEKNYAGDMDMTEDQLLELALKLPLEKRQKLAISLQESCYEDPPAEVRDALLSKAKERSKAYHEGRSKLLTREEFRALRSERRARAKIRQASQD